MMSDFKRLSVIEECGRAIVSVWNLNNLSPLTSEQKFNLWTALDTELPKMLSVKVSDKVAGLRPTGNGYSEGVMTEYDD